MSRRDPIRRRQPLPALISGVRYHYAVHATRERTRLAWASTTYNTFYNLNGILAQAEKARGMRQANTMMRGTKAVRDSGYRITNMSSVPPRPTIDRLPGESPIRGLDGRPCVFN